jgi:hypothetical protein
MGFTQATLSAHFFEWSSAFIFIDPSIFKSWKNRHEIFRIFYLGDPFVFTGTGG